MISNETLSASLEDYLEVIFQIILEKQVARAKDIAKQLKVKSSSVTGALRVLAEKELVNYAPYDVITLTPKGRAMAENVIRRHEVLRDFFIKVLAVDEAEAETTACKMEHTISDGILERFVRFVDFVELCPRGGSKWIKGFEHFCDQGNTLEQCEKCVTLCLDDVKTRKKEFQKKGAVRTMSLNQLKPGEKGKIVKINNRGPAHRRIMDMGVTRGALVEVERVAPLGDPIDIKVKGYHLSLRKEDAEKIIVEAC